MDFNLEEYKNYYEINYPKIVSACECAINKPYSKLNESLEEIIEYTKKLVNIPSTTWDDSVKSAFSSNMQSCSDNLNQITTSISEIGTKIDNLYLELPDDFLDFQTTITNLETEINNKPHQKDYRKTDPITGEVSYRDYERAISKWRDNAKTKKAACESNKTNIENKINLLKQLDGEIINLTEVISSIPGTLNLKSKFAYYTDDPNEIDSILKSSSVELIREGGKLTVRYSQAEKSKWDKTIGGINLHKSGCGVMSLATALTSSLTYQNGSDVLVTPLDLANALNDYGGLSKYFPNGMGDYDTISKAVSDIYGVTIVYNSSGNINNDQITNVTDTSATVVYSLKNESHVAAVNGVIDEKYIIADTGKGKASYLLDGTSNFDGGKRYMAISTTDFTISNGKLLKNGSSSYADIGDMQKVAINGEIYSLKRQSAGVSYDGTELYEYIVDTE